MTAAVETVPPPDDQGVLQASTGEGGEPFRLRSGRGDPGQFKPIAGKATTDTLESPGKTSKNQLGAALVSLRKSLTLRRPLTKHKQRHPPDAQLRARSFEEAPTSGRTSGRDTDRSDAMTPHESAGFAKTISMIWKGHPASTQRKDKKEKTPADHTPEAKKVDKMAAPKQPKIYFQEPNKFFIENYENLSKPLDFGDEQNASMKHAVMIHNCSNCIINITKKVNKVELDSCKKVVLHVPAVISSVDVEHSTSCEVHVKTRLPGAHIDSCDSLSLYVPRETLEDLEIASAGGGSANLMVPSENDATEFEEHPIPFQFVHRFKNGKLISEVSPLYSH